MSYTKEDIPKIKRELEDIILRLKKEFGPEDKMIKIVANKDYYYKGAYSDIPILRHTKRQRKLIELIEAVDKVEDYSTGLVILNNKFIISLINEKWRVINSNTWYRHKQDLKHFIDNYVRKTQ